MSAALLAYCRDEMLPIFELWADGHPALRRLLDCESADSRSHGECHQAVKRVLTTLLYNAPRVEAEAAFQAALACWIALADHDEVQVREVAAMAKLAHAIAIAAIRPVTR